MNGEILVVAYHSGMVVSFEARVSTAARLLAGPLKSVSRERGTADGRCIVWRCLRSMNCRSCGAHKYSTELPLVYGLSYSGCVIKYRVKSAGEIELLELTPSKSSDDFPYENYPLILPHVSLKVAETRSCTYHDFAQQFANTPEEEPAELIVAIPPPATIGVSLWGRWGDAEGVTVVFECGLGDPVVAHATCVLDSSRSVLVPVMMMLGVERCHRAIQRIGVAPFHFNLNGGVADGEVMREHLGHGLEDLFAAADALFGNKNVAACRAYARRNSPDVQVMNSENAVHVFDRRLEGLHIDPFGHSLKEDIHGFGDDSPGAPDDGGSDQE